MLNFLMSDKWRPHWARDPVIDINGKKISGPIMRRRSGPTTEYRELTDDDTVEDRWIGAIRD